MMIPKFKSTIEVRVAHNDIHFIDNIKSTIKIFESEEKVVELIKEIDGRNSEDEIYYKLKQNFEDITLEDVKETLDSMLKFGLISDEYKNSHQYSNPIFEKWNRQILFWDAYGQEGISGIDIQEKLFNSNVLIVGVGGLGSWVGMYLTQIGLGNITIIDYDHVEKSNLNRQVLFCEKDVGKLKTVAAKESLLNINSSINVTTYNTKIDDYIVLDEYLDGIDFVINCADEPNVFDTGMIVGKACMERSIPHIIGGGYNHHIGMLGPTVIPYKSPCWGCYELQLKLPEWSSYEVIKNRTKGEAPSLNILTSHIANIQSFEIIKVLTGITPPTMMGKKGEVNLNTLDTSYEVFRRQPNCKMCGKGNTSGKSGRERMFTNERI
ncbi:MULTISPECIES: HesA/MoeB/ThiF family protein [Bacillaceae]|uniref:ThiF family adenylyltransferase n=1 Tax=Evansella alkalicola TaxID=745819 RepID=A0ABS6JXB7_9BACI|nr:MULTISPECIES: ThiF family adenylyltransferase [Bacillaceae]MBU9723236.1 ThiF family adenylyltransferase [Bacillus alkalicola]